MLIFFAHPHLNYVNDEFVYEGAGRSPADMAEAWELHRRDEAGHLPGRPRWLHQHRHSQSDYDLYKRNQSCNDTQQQA